MKQLSITETLDGLHKIPSATAGWDAVLVFDQATVNDLLWQQYAEQLGGEEYYVDLPAYDFTIDDDETKLHLFGFTVTAPRLSFEGSSVDQGPTCRITLDAIGGFIVTTEQEPNEPPRVTSMRRVLPTQGHEMSFTQKLVKARVEGGSGDVVMSPGDASDFTASFLIDGLSEAAVKEAFNYYLTRVKMAEKYVLGRLGDLPSGAFTPKNFVIHTITADPTARAGSADYGDGAIVLNITFEGGTDGIKVWGDGAPYPLPAGDANSKYPAVLYISRQVIFDKVMRAQFTDNIGHGLTFSPYTESADDANSILISNAGSYWLYAGYSYIDPLEGGGRLIRNCLGTEDLGILKFPFAGDSQTKLTVKSALTGFKYSWSSGVIGQEFHFRETKWVSDLESYPLEDYFKKISLNVVVDREVDVKVSAAGLVEFVEHDRGGIDIVFTGDPNDLFKDSASSRAEEYLGFAFIRGPLPSFETFYMSNLLFPGDSRLAMSKAYLPNDLMVLGTVSKNHTPFNFPTNNNVVGRNHQLSFDLPADLRQGEVWGVEVNGKAVVGQHLSLDSTSGQPTLYTDFDERDMESGVLTIKVTAKGIIDEAPAKAVGLVHVLKRDLSLEPMYFSRLAEDTLDLSASSIKGGTIDWTILTQDKTGSRLDKDPEDPDNSGKRIYTGGSADTNHPYTLEVIEVKASGDWGTEIGYIRGVLVNAAVNLVVGFKHDPEAATLQFALYGQEGDPAEGISWSLLHGPGELTAEGFYREPQVFESGDYIVVSGAKEELPGIYIGGYLVIPLPLSRYVSIVTDDVKRFCRRMPTV